MLKRDIQPYLDRLVKREMTNRAAAAILGVSEEHLSRTLKYLGIVKVPRTKADDPKKDLIAARRSFRIELANTLSVKEAAKRANCSDRTIYRLKSKC